MIKSDMRPVHPSEILQEDFRCPLGTSANALAKALNMQAPRINDIVRERRGVSADTAMRLARYFWWGCPPVVGLAGGLRIAGRRDWRRETH